MTNDWSRDAIGHLISLGIVEGYPDGTFRQEKNITRAEMTKIVNKVLGRKPNKEFFIDGMKVWEDVDEGSWYYEDIQEATNSHEYKMNEEGSIEEWINLTYK